MSKDSSEHKDISSKPSKKIKQKTLKMRLMRKVLIIFLITISIFIALQVIFAYPNPKYSQALKDFWLFKSYMASDWMSLVFNSVSVTLNIALTYIVYMLDKKSQEDKAAIEAEKSSKQEKEALEKENKNKLIAATQWATALQFQKIETERIVDSNIYNGQIIGKFTNNPQEVYAIYLTSNVTFPFHLSINIEKIHCKLWYLFDDEKTSSSFEITPVNVDNNVEENCVDDCFYTLNAINGSSTIEIYIKPTAESSSRNECLYSLKDFLINDDHLNTIEIEISAKISDESGLYFSQPFSFTLNITGVTNNNNNNNNNNNKDDYITVVKTKYRQRND